MASTTTTTTTTPSSSAASSIPLIKNIIELCNVDTNVIPLQIIGTPTIDMERASASEFAMERNLYKASRLNKKQRIVYDYIHAHPNDISLIQAGPGTGKTFTMMCLAHSWSTPVTTVIYKHDLLYTFRHCAHRMTAAKFFIKMFGLDFYTYVALEHQLSGTMNAHEFIGCIIGLLRNAKIPDVGASLVIFDEYTVIPKPLLYVTLQLFKHHRIGAVICGDRNQLQNIVNSSHATCSSFDIAKTFSNKIFDLDKNERCGNATYNELVRYISQFSSSRLVDDFGFAMITSIFYRNCIQSTGVHDIHMAATHQELSDLQHKLVMNEKIPVSFYYINGANMQDPSRVRGILQPNGLYIPNCVMEYLQNERIQKNIAQFLPYLPLVLGSKYFIKEYSEYSQGTLIAINYNYPNGRRGNRLSIDSKYPPIFESVAEVSSTMQISTNSPMLNEQYIDSIIIRYDNDIYEALLRCNYEKNVMFDRHRDFILGHGPGKIFNFPIYPTTSMSIHMAQGRTISMNNRVDLILSKTTYQGLYVAISRVKCPSQISRVVVPNMISHLVSIIINFEELCDMVRNGDSDPIPLFSLEVFQQKFTNYVFYKISDTDAPLLAFHVIKFIDNEDAAVRREMREQILHAVLGSRRTNQRILQMPQKQIDTDDDIDGDNAITMNMILRYRQVIFALSNIPQIDSHVWLREFFSKNLEFNLLLQQTRHKPSIFVDRKKFFVLKKKTGLSDICHLNASVSDYIRKYARQTEKRDDDDEQYYLEEYHAVNMVLETSKFQCSIYKAIREKTDITLTWLMDNLKEILRREYDVKRNVPFREGPQNINGAFKKRDTKNRMFGMVFKEFNINSCSKKQKTKSS